MSNEFKTELENTKLQVQQCQQQENLSSCLQCQKVLECSLRKQYVENVYQFLNGGEQDGGFDF